MKSNKINISQAVGNRYDVSFYNERFDFISNSYPSYELGQILSVNPAVSYKHIADDDLISFVPMEAIDEQNGIIAIRKTILYSNIKGYTKFQEGDLLWAKITPCMQNGKSAIARNLVNGVGCGSTEFYVLRPKSDKVLIEYIHYILRDNRVLESARNSFGGSAGQQRVSSSYLKSIKIPLPPIEIQQQIVDIYTTAQKAKQAKEEQANTLLDSIDDYLLSQLGIILPAKEATQKIYKVKLSDLLGSRLNPAIYNPNTIALKSIQQSNTLPKMHLADMIISNIAGDWGKDESEIADNYTRCLVIRATEFDNRYNLNLDNSRTKYRQIKTDKLNKMDVRTCDILIEKSGGSPDQPVGRVAYITDEIVKDNNTVAYSNFIQKIRIDQTKANSEYVYYYLRTMYRIGITESMQSQTNGIRNLQMNNYFQQTVLLPNNQNEIVKHIRAIYTQAKALEDEAAVVLESAKKQIERMILG
ncbi:MAG: restriction endonuclease subunit S [Alistipes sp.]|nr:restriction endonuclease subunit S [Alistipes sp.]